jgi:transcriptional regulator with XRE-family HTH domain
MFITFADLAKLKGVSRSAVSQRRQSGILDAAIVKVGAREKLNKDLALELWDKNTAPVLNQVPVQTKKELKKQVDQMSADQIPDFNISRAKKEFYQAELARIQVLQQKKDLISAKEVEKKSFELAVGIREAFLTLPDRVSNLFASETDSTAIDGVLRKEIHSCLERFVEAA